MPPILLALKFKALEGAAVVTMAGILKFCPKIMTLFFHSRYCKVARLNMSCLEAHPCFFRLLIKRIFDPYAL